MTTAFALPFKLFSDASDPATGWDRVGEQAIMTLVILLGAGLIILLGRLVIGRMLSAVAETPGLMRLINLRLPATTGIRTEKSRRDRRTKTVASLLNNALAVVVSVVAFLMILDVWGFPAAPLLTSVGIVGIAVGFGFQQILRDYLAGIFITVEDQFGIGDLIETSEVKGRVRAMSLRITTVEAEDGAVWYLRNGEILRVANYSQGVTTTSLPVTPSGRSDDAEQATPTTRITRIVEDTRSGHPKGSPTDGPADTVKKPLPQKESE